MSNDRGLAPTSPRPIQVLKFKQMPVQIVRFLGELRGTMMHWDGDNTIPCLAGSCERPIHERQELVYRAYAPAEYYDAEVDAWYMTVLEFTPNLEEELRGFVLRGTCWRITKKKFKGKSLPMTAQFLEEFLDSMVRAPFDVTPILSRIYKGRLPIWGATNDQTPRVMSEPSIGNGPSILKKNRPEVTRPMTEEETRAYRVKMNLDPDTGKAVNGHRMPGKVGDYV